jgi:hypothetical protein
MGKVVRLTESQLVDIIRNIVKEESEGFKGRKLSDKNTTFSHPQLKGQSFVVISISGMPMMIKDGKRLKITKGMTITPSDELIIGDDGEVIMRWSKSNKEFQYVSLSLTDGHLDVFVVTE